MSRKKKRLLFSILLVGLVLFVSTVAIAKEVKIEAVSDLLSEKYPLDNYRSYLSTERGFFAIMNGDKIVEALNGLAEIFFTITRLLYSVFDFFVRYFYSLDAIGKLGGIISLLTNNLWEMFRSNYVTLIIVIAVLWVGKTYFMNGPKQALHQFGKIILVLVVSGIWFPRANEYLTKMNNYSFGFQTEIMKVAGSVDATSALSTDGDTSTKQATDIMRNELFKQTIYRPFLLVNYGTVNKKDINKLYEKVDDKNIPKGTNGEYLLSKEFDELKDKEKKDVLKKLAKKNKYLTGDQVGYKLVMALFSVVCLFLYGIPLIAIAVANVFLQILVLLLSYLLPIIALISLLPRFSDGLINSIVNVAKVLAAKALLALAVLMFTLINLTVDLLVAPSSVTSVLANVILKGLIYYLLWKFRDPLLKLLTRAVMSRSDSSTVNMRMKQFDRQMSDFGDPQFVRDLGTASDGNGEAFNEEDGSGSYEEPETPAYSGNDEESSVELNESDQNDTDESDGSEDTNTEDQKLDVEEPDEVSVEHPEEIPMDKPDEVPVGELDAPENLPIDDPTIEPVAVTVDADAPTGNPAETGEERPENPRDVSTASNVYPTGNNDVENQIDRQLQVYQHTHDNRTLNQDNDFSQHQTVNLTNKQVTKDNDDHFSSRLKELRD